MAYEEAKWETLSKKYSVFSGGYVDNVQDIDMLPYFSPYLRNARLDGQSIRNREGHTLHATLTAGDYPKGMAAYLRSDAANNRVVVRHNTDSTHKLYTIEADGTATSIATSTDITSDNRMTFSNVADVIYCMNGVDDFGKLSGTTYTTPSTGITNFSPSFAVTFNGAHRASGWSDNPNIVYKSVADDYEDFNSAGADQFTFSETIKGLAANDDALYYFTTNTISKTGADDIQETAGAITYFTRPLETGEGSVNHKGIVVANGRVYFVTPSNKICIVAEGQGEDGRDTIELSERKYKGISTIMSTLDKDQSDCYGVYLPKENLIKRFFKLINSTFHDICIVYDMIKDVFLVDNQKFFYDGCYLDGANYAISMIEPKVFRDEYGRDDEDSPTPFVYKSPRYYIGGATHKFRLWKNRSLVDINELAELNQKILIDDVQKDIKVIDSDNIPITAGGLGTVAIGTTALGTSNAYENDMYEVPVIRTKGQLNVKGRVLQYEWTNSTVGGKIRLKDVMPMLELLPDMANPLTV